MNKHTITITTHGGIIQAISNIPDGYLVEVKDYDHESTPAPDYDGEDSINLYD